MADLSAFCIFGQVACLGCNEMRGDGKAHPEKIAVLEWRKLALDRSNLLCKLGKMSRYEGNCCEVR